MGMDEARDLIRKGLDSAQRLNVRAIVLQRGIRSDELRKVRLEQSKSGEIRFTVLSNGRSQGEVSFDDRQRVAIYLPSRKKLLVLKSPRNPNWRGDRRLKLIEKNYRLVIDSAPRIASRKAICVIAVPKRPDIEKRRLYFDAKNGYLLRVERITQSMQRIVLQDTVEISFPERMDSLGLTPEMLNAEEIEHRDQDRDLEGDEAERTLGFSPLSLSDYPYGFQVFDSKVIRRDHFRAKIIHLGDGLALVTIFQFAPDPSDPGPPGGRGDEVMAEVRGVRVVVGGDAPESVRRRILNALVQSASP